MKPQKHTEFIDFNHQQLAMVELIKKYWDIKENESSLTKLVNFLFLKGQELAGKEFNHSGLQEFLVLNIKEIIKNKESPYNLADLVTQQMELMDHSPAGYDYHSVASEAVKMVKNDFPELKNIKPNNWRKYLKVSNENDDHEYLDIVLEMEKAFSGYELSIGSSIVWLSFPDNISLLTIGYRYERGDKPLFTFVNAIIQEGYACQLHNNGVIKVNELKEKLTSSLSTSKKLK